MWDDLDRLKDKPVISIAAGITVGLVASVVQSLGLTIQRKSHVLNQALSESQQVVEHRRPCVTRLLAADRILISDAGYGCLVLVLAFPCWATF
jgi:magnesium transporter